jgi:hypothetical protein
MSNARESHDLKAPEFIKLPTWFFGLAGAMALVGFGTFAYGLTIDPEHAWASYLIGFFMSLCIGLAGAFFVAVQFLTGAGWSVTVRRIPEALTSYLPAAALLSIPVFLGAEHLYHWAHHGAADADMVLRHKAPYLNLTRMGVFVAVGFAAWILLSGLITANSRKQDRTGEAMLTYRNARLGALFMVVFALTFSTAGFDFIMSLEAHWFSTMWAVYLFAMLLQAGFAFITLAVVLLRRTGKLDGYVNENHVHDLGKFTFAFTVFWAYIAFSQFLLIWYANLPEETVFFIKRFENGWGLISLALPIAKFFLPFLVLLPRKMKHTPAALIPVCLWILAVTFMEFYWIVLPAVVHDGPSIPWMELLVTVGFFGVLLATFGLSISRHSPVPVKDPRLAEALHHHV